MFKYIQLKHDLMWWCIINITLIVLGVIFVYSSSSYFAFETLNQPMFFVKKQCIGLLVGLVAFAIGYIIPISFFQECSFFGLIGAVIITALPLINALSHKMHGSHRWLNLKGFIFQPSELLKVALVIYLSSLLSRKQFTQKSIKHIAIPLTIIMGLIGIILLKQPDFGCLATLFATTLIMLFITNLPIRYFITTIAIALPSAFLLIYMQPYRWQRIITYLNPWQDPQGTGFQIIQALIAIGSGSWWGSGIGHSQQKYFYLPMQHTDFIFAIIAEEIGFIGCLLFLTVCVLFAWYGFKISWNLERPFSRLLVQAIIVLISLQFIINLLVSTGLAPTKGIGLPFISYGNTALVCNMFMIGLVCNTVYEEI